MKKIIIIISLFVSFCNNDFGSNTNEVLIQSYASFQKVIVFDTTIIESKSVTPDQIPEVWIGLCYKEKILNDDSTYTYKYLDSICFPIDFENAMYYPKKNVVHYVKRSYKLTKIHDDTTLLKANIFFNNSPCNSIIDTSIFPNFIRCKTNNDSIILLGNHVTSNKESFKLFRMGDTVSISKHINDIKDYYKKIENSKKKSNEITKYVKNFLWNVNDTLIFYNFKLVLYNNNS